MLEFENKGYFKDGVCSMSFLVSTNQECCGLIGHLLVNEHSTKYTKDTHRHVLADTTKYLSRDHELTPGPNSSYSSKEEGDACENADISLQFFWCQYFIAKKSGRVSTFRIT